MSELEDLSALDWNNNISGSSASLDTNHCAGWTSPSPSCNHYPDILWVQSVAFMNLAVWLSVILSSASIRERGNKEFVSSSSTRSTHDHVIAGYLCLGQSSTLTRWRSGTDWLCSKDSGQWWHIYTLLWAPPCQNASWFLIFVAISGSIFWYHDWNVRRISLRMVHCMLTLTSRVCAICTWRNTIWAVIIWLALGGGLFYIPETVSVSILSLERSRLTQIQPYVRSSFYS
jgi:hypothetical protein